MTQDRTMTDEPLPTDRDDLHDHLLDRALREKLGGEKAPDLAEKIVAAARPVSTAAAAAIIENPVSPMPFRRGWLAIAASLLVAVGIGLLSPAMQAHRERAMRSAESATLDNRAEIKSERVPLASSEEQVLVEQTRRRESEKLIGGSPVQATAPFPGAQARPEVLLGDGAPSEAVLPQLSSPAGPSGDQAGEGQPGAASPEGDYILDLAASTVQPDFGAGPQQAQNRYGEPAAAGATVVAGTERDDSVLRQIAQQRARESSASSNPTATTGYEYGANWDSLAGGHGGEQGAGQQAVEQNFLGTAVDPRLVENGFGDQPGRRSQRPYYEREQRLLRHKYLKEDSLALSTLGWHDGRRHEFPEAQATGDNYAPIIDNPFRTITADSAENRLSTFSIDVDTASYANVRQFLMQSNMLPPPDAVRIEELVNYFTYDYAGPGESDEPVARNAAMMEARMAAANRPFAANIEVAACPWAPKHRLVRFGIKGREVERAARPKSNLVFLVDVSGSMDDPQKLPLLVDGMRMLTQELGENDRVAIVVYASTEGLALESTRGDQQETILAALDRLSAGGSTAGGAGIQLAYKVAADNFIEGGTNRVILCTDGDFNVGVTDVEALKQLAADKAKDTGVFLTVLGFGRGNLNDELMEAVADNGNGAYHYVDNRSEARKVLVEQMTGTLVTIAKDVKIQVEFNPTQVAAYRLIGYENRVLAAEDFNNDAKDAGEIGAGHTVTALYEIVPIGEEVATTNVDELKYAPPAAKVELNQFDSEVDEQKYSADAEASSELLTLKIRYKQPDGDTSTKLEFPVADAGQSFSKASSDFQFASSVAGFGMLLRGSPYKGDATFAGMLEIAESSAGNEDPHGYRREFTQMIARAKQLAGE
jgi:Ca-activated chloride channel family protein